MLNLFTFGPEFGLPSPSPFCLKAMILLEMSGLTWQPIVMADPRKMQFSKLPVLEVDGRKIPESQMILDYLEQHCPQLRLSPRDQAIAHAITRMAEDYLHNALVNDRWLDPDIWPDTRAQFFQMIPRPVRGIVTRKIQGKKRGYLLAHGMAAYDAKTRAQMLDRDFQTIEVMLESRAYLLGDRPSSADAAVAPFLHEILSLPKDTDLKRRVRQSDTLTSYAQRMADEFYPAIFARFDGRLRPDQPATIRPPRVAA